MNAIITPAKLAGTVCAPASKSAAHRALICAALADGPTAIRINALNRDIEATLACLAALGAGIRRDGERVEVSPIPTGASAPRAGVELDCGESGSTLRFLLPVVCTLGVDAKVVGRGRLPQRPNAALTDALREHGAHVDGDAPPMRLGGPISAGRWALPGNVSSQYVTGLLFALPLLSGDSEIVLTTKLESAAYVTMTLQALAAFGVRVEPTEAGCWRVPGGQRYQSPGMLEVEGDWSAAAFWHAANALGADIRVEGLNPASAQGDRAALELLGRPRIDASDVPDLVPALAAAAARLPQTTVITGAARLRLKESDRLATTAAMLRSLGHGCEITEDGLIIRDGAPEPCDDPVRDVDGANDHRIVMAAAVAAAFADRPVRVRGIEAVEKSYPDFFRDYTELGGQIHVEHPGQ